MKVKLNIFERFILLSMMPKENSYALLRVIRKLQEILAPSEEENETFGIKEVTAENGEKQTKWNPEKSMVEVELEFSSKQVEVITDALKDLDKKKKITLRHVSLWEKFIGEEE